MHHQRCLQRGLDIKRPTIEGLVQEILLIDDALDFIDRAATHEQLCMRTHAHSPQNTPHFHLHSHVHGADHTHSHPQGDARRSLGFGLLHGLAGSAAILVLLVAAAPTRAAQLAYFVAFATGTMIGMLVVSFSLAGVVRLASRQGARWATWLHVGSAVASVVVGVLLAVRVAAEP